MLSEIPDQFDSRVIHMLVFRFDQRLQEQIELPEYILLHLIIIILINHVSINKIQHAVLEVLLAPEIQILSRYSFFGSAAQIMIQHIGIREELAVSTIRKILA